MLRPSICESTARVTRRNPVSAQGCQVHDRAERGRHLNVMRLAAAQMAEQPESAEERGVMLCTVSVAALDGQVGQAAYSTSKAGVAGMTLPVGP